MEVSTKHQGSRKKDGAQKEHRENILNQNDESNDKTTHGWIL